MLGYINITKPAPWDFYKTIGWNAWKPIEDMPIDEARKKFLVLMGAVYKRNGREYLRPK